MRQGTQKILQPKGQTPDGVITTMKIKVLKSALSGGLKKVKDAIPSKQTLAILSNVKIKGEGKKLELTATNLDMTIHAVIGCEADGDGVLETTAPGRLMDSIVGSLPDGVIELEFDGQSTLMVSGGESLFRLPCMAAKDFPVMPEMSDGNSYTISAMALKEIIRKTEYAMSDDDTRKSLNGTLFEFANDELTAVATDGRRLAKVCYKTEIPEGTKCQYIIPSSCIAVIGKVLPSDDDVVLKAAKSQMSFEIRANGMTIFTKLLDDVYPNYKQVIPANSTNEVEINRVALMEAVTRCALMGDADAGKYVRFSIAENRLVVTVNNAATGGEARDVVPVKYDGPQLEAMFDPKYIMDPLKAVDADEIILTMNEATFPKLITVKGLPYMCVVMPIRIH